MTYLLLLEIQFDYFLLGNLNIKVKYSNTLNGQVISVRIFILNVNSSNFLSRLNLSVHAFHTYTSANMVDIEPLFSEKHHKI